MGLRFVDLFAGIGGFHHGLKGHGECVLAVEIDAACREVYSKSFSGSTLAADIRDLCPDEVPNHDLLCAGFPCQPFSKSGYQHGLRDRTRGTLFFDIVSILLAKQPRYVILENVRNIAGPRHRETWRTVIDSLRSAGYAVESEPLIISPHRLSHEQGGAPQVRDRVFILAAHERKVPGAMKLVAEAVQACRDAQVDPPKWRIADHLLPDAPARYKLRDDELDWLAAWQEFVQGIEADSLPGFPLWADCWRSGMEPKDTDPHWKAEFIRKNVAFYQENRAFIDPWLPRIAGFPASRRKLEWQARTCQPTRAERDLESLVLHFRPSGIRVKSPTYLPALVAITQTSIIGPEVSGGSAFRRISPEEAASLQGLDPCGFRKVRGDDVSAYRQLGNAVNAGVVSLIARHFLAPVAVAPQ